MSKKKPTLLQVFCSCLLAGGDKKDGREEVLLAQASFLEQEHLSPCRGATVKAAMLLALLAPSCSARAS